MPRVHTTTKYGTWCSLIDQFALTLEQTVVEAFGAEGPDGFDLEEIVTEYRDAIDKALPAGVSLAGDEFYGPAFPEKGEFAGYPSDEYGRLDIAAIVNGEDGVGGVDLWKIIQRHEIA